MRPAIRHWPVWPGLLLALIACGQPELPDLPLTSGRTLGSLVAGRDSVTLILLDPGDCYVCDRRLARWLDVLRQRPDGVLLVLTRQPEALERRRLQLGRIRPDAILSPSLRYANLPHPSAYRFVAGVVAPPPR
jgi:hypothetical protein